MDEMTSKGTEYTGPGSRIQGPVSREEHGDGSELYMLVLKDVVERAEFGAKKYGHPLRTTAEVDFATNAYQEVLDLLIYFRGEIELNRKRNDLLYEAWALIANAGWDAATGKVDIAKHPGWHGAAISWRNRFHELLRQLTSDSEAPVDRSLTNREDSGTL